MKTNARPPACGRIFQGIRAERNYPFHTKGMAYEAVLELSFCTHPNKLKTSCRRNTDPNFRGFGTARRLSRHVYLKMDLPYSNSPSLLP